MHGDADMLVDYDQSVLFEKLLEDAGYDASSSPCPARATASSWARNTTTTL